MKGQLPLHTQLSKNGITEHITKQNIHGGAEEKGVRQNEGFKGSGKVPRRMSPSGP